MAQEERDWLCTLKQTKKGLRTQREAAEELGVTERQIRRLLKQLSEQGDRAVIHGLIGKPSNHKIEEAIQKRAMRILSRKRYQGFGPTLAWEPLREQHGIEASRETVRHWRIEGGLWRARRSRYGEMVQWDTSEHDWLG